MMGWEFWCFVKFCPGACLYIYKRVNILGELMSVNVTVGNGQGITQAIKSHLEKQGVKLTNVKLSDWQKVMSLVNQNQQAIEKHNSANPNDMQKSIFKGGNDVNRIAQNNGDNNWKTDFKVNAGQVMQFDAGIFNKIVAVLTGKAQETPDVPQHEAPGKIDAKPISLAETIETPLPDKLELPAGAQRQITENTVDSLGGKIIQREVNGEKQDIAVVTIDGQKVRRAINEDGTLGDTLAATKTFGKNEYISGDFPAGTKILEREVNGQKQQIAVYEDENGNKVRSLVIKDPETGENKLGDNLVAVSTLGKNKYITQTEMDNKMRTALGLPADAEIPEDIQGSFVSIGGSPTLIFKKDGKTMDQAQLREYVSNLKAQQTTPAVQNGETVLEISDAEKQANEIFDLINNEYGDKKGNITAEEYVNYEFQTADPQMKSQYSEEKIRQGAQMVFDAMDSDADGQVTKDELKAFIEQSNQNNDTALTDTEMADYVSDNNDALAEQQNKVIETNISNVRNAGYEIGHLEDGTFVYQKDGKSFSINLDGTIGEEIKN